MWLTTCHVRRYHRLYKGSGHVWQGRYKSFAAEGGKHLLAVLKYVERNPVRAGLVKRAEHWPWSSAGLWGSGSFSAETGSGSRRVPDPISAVGRHGDVRPGTGAAETVSGAGLGHSGKGQAQFRSEIEPDPEPIEHWLQRGPTPRPADWLRWVNDDENAEQLARLRECVNRGAPFGNPTWRTNAARKLGLESSLRPRGRPPKRKKK